jgi:hypothetical protein
MPAGSSSPTTATTLAEYPTRITIVTGVPRGDEMPLVVVPQLPAAAPAELASIPKKDD